MRFARLSWFLLLAWIGVVCAEGLSWSTPIILMNILVWPLYGVHYLLIVDFLARRRALTIPALAVGGLVLGLATESLMTKVIWNPPWEQDQEEPILRFLGLGVFEVGWICAIWHVWMSTAIPLSLAMYFFGQGDLLSDHTARRLLRALPLVTGFTTALQQGNPLLMGLGVLGILVNGAGIALLAWFYLRHNPSQPPPMLVLARRERWVVWGLTGLFYLLLLPARPDAFPGSGPLLLGLGLVVGSLVFFVRMGHNGASLTPGPVRYRPRAFGRYLVYFLLTSLLIMLLTILVLPVAFGATVIFIVLSSIVGNVYLLRLAWRAFRPLRSGRVSAT